MSTTCYCCTAIFLLHLHIEFHDYSRPVVVVNSPGRHHGVDVLGNSDDCHIVHFFVPLLIWWFPVTRGYLTASELTLSRALSPPLTWAPQSLSPSLLVSTNWKEERQKWWRKLWTCCYLCHGLMSTNPHPGIDYHPMSAGFVTLAHLLKIFNMLGVGLPTNSTDLGISEIFFESNL